MKKFSLIIMALGLSLGAFSQQKFEESVKDTTFEKVRVNVGGDFAMQYQALDHSADSALIPLGTGINLPTANFSLSALLARGVKVKLITYLSSRHHTEAWVKGGYLLMDELPFLKSDAIDRAMDLLTIKVGVMELNYGDAHFRRSDNGEVIDNPFVGNYIMDAFTTAPAAEVLFRKNGILAMAGLTSGTLRPQMVSYSNGNYTEYNMYEELAFYWKAGYDKELSDDARIRATLSGYHNKNHHFGSLYNGDRTGSRYYLVMKEITNSSSDVDPATGHTTGRFGPGFTDQNNAIMANIFATYMGFEVFGTYETTSGTSAFGGAEYKFSQYAVEGLYHFGGDDQFYGGARINKVSNDNDQEVFRYQLIAGWNITKNIILKAEYVNQDYTGFTQQFGDNAGFNGLMVEAGISF